MLSGGFPLPPSPLTVMACPCTWKGRGPMHAEIMVVLELQSKGRFTLCL
jgi:hypothetical protein